MKDQFRPRKAVSNLSHNPPNPAPPTTHTLYCLLCIFAAEVSLELIRVWTKMRIGAGVKGSLLELLSSSLLSALPDHTLLLRAPRFFATFCPDRCQAVGLHCFPLNTSVWPFCVDSSKSCSSIHCFVKPFPVYPGGTNLSTFGSPLCHVHTSFVAFSFIRQLLSTTMCQTLF